MLMRERSGAPPLFGPFAIGIFCRIDRIKKSPASIKERGADIGEPREGSSLGGYLAKLTISAAVTDVTLVPFIIWTYAPLAVLGGAVCQRLPEYLARPKSFGTARGLIGRKGHLSLV